MRLLVICAIAGGAVATPRAAIGRSKTCVSVVDATIPKGGTRFRFDDEVAVMERLFAATRAAPDDRACRDLAASVASQVARIGHQVWAHDPARARAADAAQLYRLELAAFPDAPTAAQDEYYLADLLYARAKTSKQVADWETSATAFETVLAHGGLGADQLGEAAYAAAMARKAAFEASDDGGTGDALPRRAEKMLAAFHRYAATAVGHTSPEAVVMIYLEARVDDRFHRDDDAIAHYRELVEQHRDSEVAAPAAILLIDLYTRDRREHERSVFVGKLASDPAYLKAHPDLAAVVRLLVP